MKNWSSSVWAALAVVAILLMATMGVYTYLRLNNPRWMSDHRLVAMLERPEHQYPTTWESNAQHRAVQFGIRVSPVLRELSWRMNQHPSLPIRGLASGNPETILTTLRLADGASSMRDGGAPTKAWTKAIRDHSLLSHSDKRVRWMSLELLMEWEILSTDELKVALADDAISIRLRAIRALLYGSYGIELNDGEKREVIEILLEHFDEGGRLWRYRAYYEAYTMMYHLMYDHGSVDREIVNRNTRDLPGSEEWIQADEEKRDEYRQRLKNVWSRYKSKSPAAE